MEVGSKGMKVGGGGKHTEKRKLGRRTVGPQGREQWMAIPEATG